MKLQIDFYSNIEMSIQTNWSEGAVFKQEEVNKLFLLACYILRQFWNFGQDIVSRTIAGLLVSHTDISNLYQKKPTLPTCNHLLNNFLMQSNKLMLELTDDTETLINYSLKLADELDYKSWMKQAVDDNILVKLPQLTEYRGKGSKSFTYTFPPPSLVQKGFGVFGHNLNYFGFHSIVGLIRFLGQKHVKNKIYLGQLSNVTQMCGSMHILNKIPIDQVYIAKEIVASAIEQAQNR